jgi:hypothetical protein
MRVRMRVEKQLGRAIVARRSGAQRVVTRSVDEVAESYETRGYCCQVKTIVSPGNVSNRLFLAFESTHLY